ncbi:hypothetical protein HY358_01140 [Candidatus Roizmanbacteria bacterium]|nr:hypothetical protein [Candidatus Roizmanbacteria bacterium]
MNITTNIDNLEKYKIVLKVEETTHLFFKKHGFVNVHLPVLSPALIPESYLEIFQTEFSYHQKRQRLFLTPSPELFLKRLLAHGIGNCYYLGKSFRNAEPASNLHSFEFCLLEFYKVDANYLDIADELLLLLQELADSLYVSSEIKYRGKRISLSRWERLSVAEAFQKYANIYSSDLFDPNTLREKARQKGYKVDGFSYEDIFSQIYVQEIEPQLGVRGYPTLLYDYPKQFAALAKLNKDKKTAQRFEFYIEGIELGDCYSELTDWKEQEMRFTEEVEKRKHANKIPHTIDKGFIETLQYGLNPCAGIAIGFDRLAMIFADATSIHDLQLISIQ